MAGSNIRSQFPRTSLPAQMPKDGPKVKKTMSLNKKGSLVISPQSELGNGPISTSL